MLNKIRMYALDWLDWRLQSIDFCLWI